MLLHYLQIAYGIIRPICEVCTPVLLALVLRSTRAGAGALLSLREAVDSAHRAAHAAESTAARTEAAAETAEQAAKTAAAHAEVMTGVLRRAQDENERERDRVRRASAPDSAPTIKRAAGGI